MLNLAPLLNHEPCYLNHFVLGPEQTAHILRIYERILP